MATSGSIDFSVSRDDIITEALELLGVLAEGESPNSDQLASCGRTLNMMVKAWQAEGLNLFAVQRLYLFLETDKSKYTIYSSGDNCTASFNQTSVSASASTGALSFDVDSITGISNGDHIGIEQANNTVQWTTVNGVPSGSTITITDALVADVAIDATVYSYTTKANRPMKIMNQVLTDSSGRDIWIDKISRDEYVTLPDKSTNGKVNQIYFDPQISAADLYVWPQSDNELDYLTLWVQRTLEDFDASSDTPDFPQEWYLAIATNLALLLVPKYGIERSLKADITEMAVYYKMLAESYDTEDGFMIQPHDQMFIGE